MATSTRTVFVEDKSVQGRKGYEEAKTWSIFLNICSRDEFEDQSHFSQRPFKKLHLLLDDMIFEGLERDLSLKCFAKVGV